MLKGLVKVRHDNTKTSVGLAAGWDLSNRFGLKIGHVTTEYQMMQVFENGIGGPTEVHSLFLVPV